MDNIKKQAFTRRLSQCNKGEMVVIMYEICFAYMDDVKKAYEEDRHGDFLESLRKVTRTIDELVNALDHQYDLSHQLYRLYQFCKREIARCTYENQVEGLLEAEKILTRLYKSFVEVAKKDELDSEYLMLWFSRPEFDRYARWRSEGSAHEFFTFEMMQNVKIPLPPIEVQHSIVNLYNCLVEAKKIASEAREKLKILCPALVQRAANS